MAGATVIMVIAIRAAPTVMSRVAGASPGCIVADRMCDAAVTMPAVTIALGDDDDDDDSDETRTAPIHHLRNHI